MRENLSSLGKKKKDYIRRSERCVAHKRGRGTWQKRARGVNAGVGKMGRGGKRKDKNKKKKKNSEKGLIRSDGQGVNGMDGAMKTDDSVVKKKAMARQKGPVAEERGEVGLPNKTHKMQEVGRGRGRTRESRDDALKDGLWRNLGKNKGKRAG